MPKSSATVDVDVELVGRLRIAVTRLSRLLRQQDDFGTTPTAMSMLATIGRAGPLTFGKLAALEQLAPPTVTKAVSRLEIDGLVERLPDPVDRRVCRLTLSAKGSRLLATLQTRRTAWMTKQFAALSPDDQATLAAAVEVLERMAEP